MGPFAGQEVYLFVVLGNQQEETFEHEQKK